MKNKWIKQISFYCYVTIGTFLMAAGVNIIYEPMSMVTGGFAGVGILLQKIVPIPLWVVTVALNFPLFLIAWKMRGKSFVTKTLYSTLCFSFALAVVPQFPVAHEDYLMAALLGGSLNGAGLALVFRQGASTGGTDLLASLLEYLFPSVSAPVLLALVDGSIVVLGMVVFGVRIGLYSIVAVVVTTKLMDSILEGMKFAKMLYIISEKPEKIAELVMEQLDRGVTALHGTGMYSGTDKEVLMCAVSRKQSVSIMNRIKETDPAAFVIVSDAREVMGEGFTL